VVKNNVWLQSEVWRIDLSKIKQNIFISLFSGW
jgi:hypothetical protein